MYHELGRGLAYLPALSCQTSPDLGSTVGSALGEGHRQVGAWTEAVTMCGGVRDPEKRGCSAWRGACGGPYCSLRRAVLGQGEESRARTENPRGA